MDLAKVQATDDQLYIIKMVMSNARFLKFNPSMNILVKNTTNSSEMIRAYNPRNGM